METIAASFSRKVNPGDIIVAGKISGAVLRGKHAPLAIKGCGIGAVIAESFAGIFFRT